MMIAAVALVAVILLVAFFLIPQGPKHKWASKANEVLANDSFQMTRISQAGRSMYAKAEVSSEMTCFPLQPPICSHQTLFPRSYSHNSDQHIKMPRGRSCSNGKSSWPELVGTRGEEAVAIIMKENPSVRAHTIYLYTMYPPSFCALTQDLRFNRVLVFIDQRGLVALPPKIG